MREITPESPHGGWTPGPPAVHPGEGYRIAATAHPADVVRRMRAFLDRHRRAAGGPRRVRDLTSADPAGAVSR